MRVKIFPYKLGSKSAKQLAKALKIKRIIPGSNYVPTKFTKVINWGASSFTFSPSSNTINSPNAVAIASNKLSAFQALKQANISTVEFTTSASTVAAWLNVGNKVVVRHKLSANSGDGIQILRQGDVIPFARLYTKYMRKDREFRIHVFQGKIFDFQEKKRKNLLLNESINSNSNLIRSHLNGWVFCRAGIICPDYIQREAIKAVSTLGLDFGAVDIIDTNGKGYILEINTAPGLEATTLNKYVDEFKKMINAPNYKRAYVSSW